MAQYQIKARDGKTYIVEGPEKLDPASIEVILEAKHPGANTPKEKPSEYRNRFSPYEPEAPPPVAKTPKTLSNLRTLEDLGIRLEALDRSYAHLRAPIPDVPERTDPLQLERIGGNLKSGLSDAGENTALGIEEALGYGNHAPTKLAGYKMPSAISGTARAIGGAGRTIGALGGTALDMIGTSLNTALGGDQANMLPTEMLGAAGSKILEGAQYLSGSKTPGADFAKWTQTDPRYYEAFLSSIPAGGLAAKSAFKGSLKNAPRRAANISQQPLTAKQIAQYMTYLDEGEILPFLRHLDENGGALKPYSEAGARPYLENLRDNNGKP